MITIATVSGPAASIASSSSSSSRRTNSSSVSSGGRWYRFVFRTWITSGTSGSNGSRSAGMPLIESAPMVVPWYAMWREIAFQRFCSPRAA
jgi:hypothetical protein